MKIAARLASDNSQSDRKRWIYTHRSDSVQKGRCFPQSWWCFYLDGAVWELKCLFLFSTSLFDPSAGWRIVGKVARDVMFPVWAHAVKGILPFNWHALFVGALKRITELTRNQLCVTGNGARVWIFHLWTCFYLLRGIHVLLRIDKKVWEAGDAVLRRDLNQNLF